MPAKTFSQLDPDARAKLAKKHWPKGITRDRAMNEQFRLGWPYLRVLVEKGGPKEGEKELRRIDPEMFVVWPRAAAERYLNILQPKLEGVERADSIIQASVSRAVGYAFIWEHAMFLLEQELGPETMADRVVTCLEGLKATDWADTNPHNKLLVVIFCLECFLLRSDRKTAGVLANRIRAIAKKRKKTTPIGQRLQITIRGKGPMQDTDMHRYITTDKALCARLMKRFPSWRVDPQLLYVLGPSLLTPDIIEPMRRDPAWKLEERKAIYGAIQHPMIAAMLGTQEKSLASKKKLTEAELDREGKKCIAKLVADVKAARGKKKDEKRIWTHAVHTLIELRAAFGHPCPEELLGHILGLDGWGRRDKPAFELLEATGEERERWFGYIYAASS